MAVNYQEDDLVPDMVAKSLAEVDLDQLSSMHVRALFIDLDGTIVRAVLGFAVETSVLRWLMVARHDYRMQICILSNAAILPMAARVWWIAKKLDLPYRACYWPGRMKPDPTVFEGALKLFDGDIKPSEAAVIGDQTKDVIGANRSGMTSVYVAPIQPVPWFKQSTHERDLRLLREVGVVLPT